MLTLRLFSTDPLAEPPSMSVPPDGPISLSECLRFLFCGGSDSSAVGWRGGSWGGMGITCRVDHWCICGYIGARFPPILLAGVVKEFPWPNFDKTQFPSGQSGSVSHRGPAQAPSRTALSSSNRHGPFDERYHSR